MATVMVGFRSTEREVSVGVIVAVEVGDGGSVLVGGMRVLVMVGGETVLVDRSVVARLRSGTVGVMVDGSGSGDNRATMKTRRQQALREAANMMRLRRVSSFFIV